MKLEKVKRAIIEVIEPRNKPSVISIIYNALFSSFLITSLVLLFIDLFVPEENPIHQVLHIIDYICIGVFALEYFLKIFASQILYPEKGWFKSKLAYFTSFDSFVDLVCLASLLLNLIPGEFMALRLLKLFKLVRLVKLKRSIGEIFKKESGHSHERSAFTVRAEEVMNGKTYSNVSIVIILLSFIVPFFSYFDLSEPTEVTLFVCEIAFTIYLVIEYCLRILIAEYKYPNLNPDHAKTRYIFSFIGIVDFLSLLPLFFFITPELRESMTEMAVVVETLQLIRVIRILKLSRYIKE